MVTVFAPKLSVSVTNKYFPVSFSRWVGLQPIKVVMICGKHFSIEFTSVCSLILDEKKYTSKRFYVLQQYIINSR